MCKKDGAGGARCETCHEKTARMKEKNMKGGGGSSDALWPQMIRSEA